MPIIPIGFGFAYMNIVKSYIVCQSFSTPVSTVHSIYLRVYLDNIYYKFNAYICLVDHSCLVTCLN